MVSRKQSILLILVILSSFAKAKDKCPQKCECSDDFSVVKCRGMEKFPVVDFAPKVKTLDLTHGNIKTIHENEVKAYKNLETLFISHNPLDCDHVTTHTLKHFLRENAKLKSFDGHKIKCQDMMVINSKHPQAMDASGHVHHGTVWAWPGHGAYVYDVYGRSLTSGKVAGLALLITLGLVVVTGICCAIVRYKRRSCGSLEEKVSDAEDPMSQMEEGTAAAEPDTTFQALMEGLRKQRRGSQGFPENAIVDSEEGDVVEEEDYLKEKMKKQRRLSQGYVDGAGSSDEESAMIETNLNEDFYNSARN